MVKLYNGGTEIDAHPGTVEQMKRRGWSEKPPKKSRQTKPGDEPADAGGKDNGSNEG